LQTILSPLPADGLSFFFFESVSYDISFPSNYVSLRSDGYRFSFFLLSFSYSLSVRTSMIDFRPPFFLDVFFFVGAISSNPTIVTSPPPCQRQERDVRFSDLSLHRERSRFTLPQWRRLPSTFSPKLANSLRWFPKSFMHWVECSSGNPLAFACLMPTTTPLRSAP